MDYKHRVPGNKKRKRNIEWIPRQWHWPLAGGGVVLIVLGLWLGLRGEGPEKADDDAAGRTSQNLTMPPVGPPQPPADKLPRPAQDKEVVKVEIPKEQTALAGRAPKEETTKAKADVLPQDSEQAVAQPPAPIRFTFYKILPEKEVIIPESDLRDLKRDEKLGNANKPQQYLIQVGSYNALPEAEKVKARLAQLKVRSKVESMRIEGIEWHRVNIGPFDKVNDADRVRDYLKQNQISSVVQKSTSK